MQSDVNVDYAVASHGSDKSNLPRNIKEKLSILLQNPTELARKDDVIREK